MQTCIACQSQVSRQDHSISVYWWVGELVVTVGGVREILAGREGGWKRRIFKIEFVYGHSWKRRNLYIVWKKREDFNFLHR